MISIQCHRGDVHKTLLELIKGTKDNENFRLVLKVSDC